MDRLETPFLPADQPADVPPVKEENRGSQEEAEDRPDRLHRPPGQDRKQQ